MLESLHIEHLAIIDYLDIQFGTGLNIITGETGAGKSIIVNAIKLLLGERATAEVIRHGEETAVIEAFFSIEHTDVQRQLEDIGLEPGPELLVKRLISRSGKNRVFINGHVATLQMLNQIVTPLLTLSGQHEYQRLLLPAYQIQILDKYAELKDIKRQFQGLFERLSQALHQKEKLLQQVKEQQEKRELLTFQLKEIEGAKLSPEEEERLNQQRAKLRHVEFLKQVAERGYLELYSKEGAVTEILASLAKEMEGAVGYEPKWQKWIEILKTALYQLEDLAHSFQDYKERLMFEPESLDAIEARLAEIERLKRKYKAQSVDELLQRKTEIEKALKKEESLAAEIEELKREIDDLKEVLTRLAQLLTEQRQHKGKLLKEKLETHLQSLGMPNARCEIKLIPVETGMLLKNGLCVTENGAETVEFLFSSNPGEPLRPLAKIASGGELARFLLAIKSILGKRIGTETIIFDEIDTGVGGDMGSIIGERLKQLAKTHQIICITHLPQIACYGDNHFRVEKKIIAGRTITTVRPLDREERIEELVRMLGGEKTSRLYAEVLLNHANK
ncbi:MAG: DNA repair protein RecN [Candidatus Desulfofervidaceae bacterium]|nr:DNA repair protein RecN [Candidatus Desulfofervidaceae bacterium]